MRTIQYLQALTSAVNNITNNNYSWNIEDFGNNVGEAYTNILTIGGPRTLVVRCDGLSVLPAIVLADAESVQSLSEQELVNALLLMNAINHAHGNVAVAFISPIDNAAFLRGVNYLTFQNELNTSNYNENILFMQAAGSVADYINSVGQDLAGNALVELMRML